MNRASLWNNAQPFNDAVDNSTNHIAFYNTSQHYVSRLSAWWSHVSNVCTTREVHFLIICRYLCMFTKAPHQFNILFSTLQIPIVLVGLKSTRLPRPLGRILHKQCIFLPYYPVMFHFDYAQDYFSFFSWISIHHWYFFFRVGFNNRTF